MWEAEGGRASGQGREHSIRALREHSEGAGHLMGMRVGMVEEWG